MERKDGPRVKSAVRTFGILDAIQELGGARFTELDRHLDLPTSTVHE